MSFEDCLKKRLLIRIKPQPDLFDKEISEAERDLERARHTLEVDKDFKWTIVKAYFSMFHSVKGILYIIGLKERNHGCVAAALEKVSKKGLIESYLVEEFKRCMESREDADYRHEYSRETAEQIIIIAEEFLAKMKELSKRVGPNEI